MASRKRKADDGCQPSKITTFFRSKNQAEGSNESLVEINHEQ